MTEGHVETVEHHIGATGLLTLDIVDGSVRVRGADVDQAQVTVRMPWGEALPGSVNVQREADELRVDVRGIPPTRGLRGMFRRELPSVDMDVVMPENGRLNVNGVSADLLVSGVYGDQRHRTVSGDLHAVGVEGRFAVHAVSGDVRVEGGRYSIEAVTTSGDLEFLAERLLVTTVRSVSGDVGLATRFDPEADHRVETVSGDLRIAPVGGLTIVARGLSTQIDAQVPHRSESRSGRRTVVIGDGDARLDFRSMSGDVSVVEGGTDDPSRTDRPTEPLAPAPAQPPPPTPAPRPAEPVHPPRDQLSILRALERGDIDVDEATRLIEEIDHG